MAQQTIKRRIMDKINEKIKQAEGEYYEGCIKLDMQLESDKEKLADKKVDEVLQGLA